MLISIILKKLPGAAAFFAHSKGLTVQFIGKDQAAFIKWVVFSGGKNQTIINNGDHYQIRRLDFTFHYRSIQLRF